MSVPPGIIPFKVRLKWRLAWYCRGCGIKRFLTPAMARKRRFCSRACAGEHVAQFKMLKLFNMGGYVVRREE